MKIYYRQHFKASVLWRQLSVAFHKMSIWIRLEQLVLTALAIINVSLLYRDGQSTLATVNFNTLLLKRQSWSIAYRYQRNSVCLASLRYSANRDRLIEWQSIATNHYDTNIENLEIMHPALCGMTMSSSHKSFTAWTVFKMYRLLNLQTLRISYCSWFPVKFPFISKNAF